MEGEVRERESFFKVMMPGFEQTLNLPEAISKKLKLQKSVEAIVKSRTGEWKMEMCRNHELGLICFKDGWSNFFQGHGLMTGDFVTFEHIGNFHFNVVVFGISACEKDYFVADSDSKKDSKDAPKKDQKGRTAVGISFKSKNPFFILTMKHYHAIKSSHVNVPEKFWRLNDIGEETSMVLRDPSRREWLVKLYINQRGQCRMKSGWYHFYAANELKMGDVCALELIRKKLKNVVVLDVHIFPEPSL